MSDIPPGIDAKDFGNVMSAADFPLSPVESWMIMRGYWVKPRQPVNADKLLTLPGVFEMIDGYIGLR